MGKKVQIKKKIKIKKNNEKEERKEGRRKQGTTIKPKTKTRETR